MKKFMIMSLFVASFLLLLIGCSSEEPSDNNGEGGESPDYVSILGASDGGTFFLLANGMADLFNDEMSSGDYSAQSTSGTNDILQQLNDGDGEIGFAQASMAGDAVEGEGYFEDNAQDNVVGLSYMYPNVMHLVVNKKSGIEKPEELKGKKVGVGEPGGGVEVDSKRLLEALDIDMDDDLKAEHVTGAQGSDMLRNNQLDALIMPGGLGASNTLEILSSKNFEVIPIPKEVVDTLIEINPAYLEFEIPADTYPNQGEAIQTYAEANWLYARKDLSEDFVYEIMKTLYDNQERMIDVHDSIENMTLENSQNGKMTPLHQGAKKFFEENDVDIDK